MNARERRTLQRALERKYGEELNVRIATAKVLGHSTVTVGGVKLLRGVALNFGRLTALQLLRRETAHLIGKKAHTVIVDDIVQFRKA